MHTHTCKHALLLYHNIHTLYVHVYVYTHAHTHGYMNEWACHEVTWGRVCMLFISPLDEPTTGPSEPPPTPATPPTLVCTNGRVYTTCGTACPATCENVNGPVLACTEQCVVGCFCPAGKVLNGDTCVAPSECPRKWEEFRALIKIFCKTMHCKKKTCDRDIVNLQNTVKVL